VLLIIKWWKSGQHFVKKHSKAKYVQPSIVSIETLKHLWAKVLWRTAKRIRSFLQAYLLGKSEICNTKVTLHIDEYVFRLEIPEDDVVLVKMLEAQQELTHVKTCKIF
jgi:hypothetical protein